MSVIEVDLKNFAHRFGERERQRVEEISKAAVEAAAAGVAVVVAAAPKDTGALRQSVRPDGTSIIVDAPHAAIVDLGSRPHWPPRQPIEDWVRRVIGGDDQAVARIAFAVRKKIAAVGTRPTFFVRDSIPKLVKQLAHIVARRFASL